MGGLLISAGFNPVTPYHVVHTGHSFHVVAKLCKISLLCVEKLNRNVGGQHFDWYHFLPPRSILIPKRGLIEGATIWHWNCGQTAADRATFCIERYWEVVGWL